MTISPITSQIILRGEVREVINTRGDTLVLMNLEDARTVLGDLLEYEVVDSLLTIYKEKDSLTQNVISMQKDVFLKLSIKSGNQQSVIDNLEQIQSNKDTEINLKDEIIKDQEREIKKQKTLKIMGFIGTIVLPIITLIALI